MSRSLEPVVSIIIPIRKGEKPFTGYPGCEVIVVDEGLERSRQRNIGINRAKGEYLLFLDSDQRVNRETIDDCLKAIRYCGSLYLRETIVTKGLFAYIRNWDRQFFTATAVDCVRFLRAKDCPYFDESMSGPEDSDWDRRVQGSKAVALYPILHEDNIGIIEFFKKKAYYAKSMKKFIEKYPNDKILDPWWRCFKVYFEKGKWRRVLKRPDLFLCVLVMNFIRGVIYKWSL